MANHPKISFLLLGAIFLIAVIGSIKAKKPKEGALPT
jgi:hypothetical protein